jgi:hypothetical protein
VKTSTLHAILLSSAALLLLVSTAQAADCSELSRRATEIRAAYGPAFSQANLTRTQQQIWREWELLCQTPPQPGCRTYVSSGSVSTICTGMGRGVYTSECYTDRDGGVTCRSSGQ